MFDTIQTCKVFLSFYDAGTKRKGRGEGVQTIGSARTKGRGIMVKFIYHQEWREGNELTTGTGLGHN